VAACTPPLGSRPCPPSPPSISRDQFSFFHTTRGLLLRLLSCRTSPRFRLCVVPSPARRFRPSLPPIRLSRRPVLAAGRPCSVQRPPLPLLHLGSSRRAPVPEGGAVQRSAVQRIAAQHSVLPAAQLTPQATDNPDTLPLLTVEVVQVPPRLNNRTTTTTPAVFFEASQGAEPPPPATYPSGPGRPDQWLGSRRHTALCTPASRPSASRDPPSPTARRRPGAAAPLRLRSAPPTPTIRHAARSSQGTCTLL